MSTEPEKAIRQAARVLKPGGLLYFHTFNRTPLSWLLAIHGIRFVTRDCPSHVHVLSSVLKTQALDAIFHLAGINSRQWRGIRR